MKVFQINGGVFGSTGRIMFDIAEAARQQGHAVLCAAPVTSTNRSKQPKEPYYPIGTYYGRCLSVALARITGLEGCFAVWPTYRLIQTIKKFQPDVLHLHSIHNSYLNLPMLFSYIKRNSIPVVWTLHDCWAFTGHCPYFDMARCEKWKTGCRRCPQYKSYPASILDNAAMMYRLKKKWFLGVQNLTILTPSQWLADLTAQSFLQGYPVQVIPNGIDLSVFKPTASDFRKKYHCEDKLLLLGCAFGWEERKGLDVFLELVKRLDQRYQIVLVGMDPRTAARLPEKMIPIPRTQDPRQLAGLYSTADVFVNPTREDNYPTVNMEAIACGTPVVTFRTGGSPESILPGCGAVVEKNDLDAMETTIRELAGWKTAGKGNFSIQAKHFDRKRCYQYIVERYDYVHKRKKKDDH